MKKDAKKEQPFRNVALLPDDHRMLRELAELDQRTMQNMLTAHHINPEAGAGIGMDGFTEPSLEDLIKMVKEGKIEKAVLGDDADLLLQESENEAEAKRRADFEATGSLEIPVVPFDDPGKQFLMNKIKK